MKSFRVNLDYFTTGRRFVRWSGTVQTKPGEDIFATARRNRAKRGLRVERTVQAVAVPL